MRNIVIFGAGLHANVCIDIFEKRGEYNIIGLIDSIENIDHEVFGYKVIGRQEDVARLIEEYKIDSGFIAIGDNYSRKLVYDSVNSLVPDFDFTNAIHPSVIIGRNVKIGIGIAMMAGVIANPDSVIDNFCILNTGTLLGHNSHMCEFSHLGAKSAVAGKVTIRKLASISLGVTIVDRVIIGENTVVGLGSTVLKDLPDNVLAYGAPAKVIKTRELGEKFLKSK